MDDIDLDEGGCIWLPIWWLVRLMWFVLVLPFKILKFLTIPFRRGRRRRR